LKAKNKLLFKSINIKLESSQLDYTIYPDFKQLKQFLLRKQVIGW